MKLLAVYAVFVTIGQVLAYAAGRVVESWSQTASLPVFLAFFFLALWLAWRAAVRVA